MKVVVFLLGFVILSYCQYYYSNLTDTPNFNNNNYTCLYVLDCHIDHDHLMIERMLSDIKIYIRRNKKTPLYMYSGTVESNQLIGSLRKCNHETITAEDRPMYQLDDIEEMKKVMDIMETLPAHHMKQLLNSTNIISSMCSHYKTSRELYFSSGGHINDMNHEMMLWVCEILVTRNDTLTMMKEYFHEWHEKKKARTQKEFLKENGDQIRDGDILFRNNLKSVFDSGLVKMYQKNLNTSRAFYDRRHNKTHPTYVPPKTRGTGLSGAEWKKIKESARKKVTFNLMFPIFGKLLMGHKPSPKHLNLYQSIYYTTKHHMKHNKYFKHNIVVTGFSFVKHIWTHPKHWEILGRLRDEIYYQRMYSPIMNLIAHNMNGLKNYIIQYDKKVGFKKLHQQKKLKWYQYTQKLSRYTQSMFNGVTHVTKHGSKHNYLATKRYLIDHLNRLHYNMRLSRFNSLSWTKRPSWNDEYYDTDSNFESMRYTDNNHIMFHGFTDRIQEWGGLTDPNDRGFNLVNPGDLFNGTLYIISYIFHTGRFNESNCNPGLFYLPDPADGCYYPIFGTTALIIDWVIFFISN